MKQITLITILENLLCSTLQPAERDKLLKHIISVHYGQILKLKLYIASFSNNLIDTHQNLMKKEMLFVRHYLQQNEMRCPCPGLNSYLHI